MRMSRNPVFPLAKSSGREMMFLCVFLLIANVTQPQETRGSGWVVIPVPEYRALHAKAYPVEPEPEASPVQATLTRVDYDLQVRGDVARGRASLTVDVLKDGWVRVPIPSGLLVREARLDNKLVSLAPAGRASGGQLTAILSHPGRSVLLLDIVLPIGSSAGTESIALPAADSGITRASIQLLRHGLDVQVGGGLLSEHSDTTDESKWVAYGRGNQPLIFSWRTKAEDHRTTQPLRLRGSLIELVSLGEDSTSIYAEVNLEVVQGAATEVRVQVPEKVTVNQVLGASVADWEVKSGELAVTFLEPVEQNSRFVINGETQLARDGEIEMPLLRLLKTEKDEGGVAVEVLGAGEIKDFKSHGMEEADASDLGETVASRQSPSLAAFRFRAGESASTRSLAVSVARYTQQAVLMANIEEARYQVLISKEGKSLIQARYAVRNNQRSFVKITLPPGAVVWSAALGGKPVRPGQSPDGSLLLPLEKARGGEDAPAFVVEVLYLGRGPAWEDRGKVRLALPALDLPISRTGLLLYYPPLFHISAEPGAFRTEAYANPTSEAFNLPPPAPVMSASPAKAAMGDAIQQQKDDEATQALVDKFRAKSKEGKVAGILPIGISFPAFGPSIFLISELTAENQAPAAEFSYQHEKKQGGR
jgi:hypothetical protein